MFGREDRKNLTSDLFSVCFSYVVDQTVHSREVADNPVYVQTFTGSEVFISQLNLSYIQHLPATLMHVILLIRTRAVEDWT